MRQEYSCSSSMFPEKTPSSTATSPVDDPAHFFQQRSGDKPSTEFTTCTSQDPFHFSNRIPMFHVVRHAKRMDKKCQKCKVSYHVHFPIGDFPDTTARFTHVTLDVVGPLLPPNSQCYLLTMTDHFTHWPEAVQIDNITAEMLASATASMWLARFGCPQHITTDHGREFECNLFAQLVKFCGYVHHRTTSYHPTSNGMIKCWHHSLQAVLMCHDKTWTPALPMVLLGLWTTYKLDINSLATELVYWETLCLPGEFIDPSTLQKLTQDQPDILGC